MRFSFNCVSVPTTIFSTQFSNNSLCEIPRFLCKIPKKSIKTIIFLVLQQKLRDNLDNISKNLIEFYKKTTKTSDFPTNFWEYTPILALFSRFLQKSCSPPCRFPSHKREKSRILQTQNRNSLIFSTPVPLNTEYYRKKPAIAPKKPVISLKNR